MKAQPTKATLFAVERVIAVGEELTAAEVAERAGMSTRHAREVLALLIKDGRAWSKRGEVHGTEVSLYGRPYVQQPEMESEETIRAGSFEIRTRDPVMKAVLHELDATKRELELVRTMREYRLRKRISAANRSEDGTFLPGNKPANRRSTRC